jgi:uncharacterized protein with NRDE domain
MLPARLPDVVSMCLIALLWQAHPRYRLVLVANRDEFHERPTLPLAPWTDAPDVLGGRDALHGGGWLALRGHRLVAVTNVRRPPEREGRSRGALVADLVRTDAPATQALDALAPDAPGFRPFNLLVHDGDTLAFATNLPGVPADGDDGRAFATRLLTPGLHGMSNGALDAPWPKTEALAARLDAWRGSPAGQGDAPDLAPLFDALADPAIAADAALPDTGVGLDLERFLSSAFIRSERYGTRASTVVLVADDHARIVERRFGPEGVFLGETDLRVPVAAAART